MKSVEIVLKKKQIIKYVLDKYKFQNYDTSNIGYDELSDNWDNFGKNIFWERIFARINN